MTTPSARAAIPLARYRLTAQVQQPLPLPEYAGSLLRGQFGAALRNVACMTRQPTCPGCPLLQTCPYTRIFEAQPPPKGQHALQDFSSIPNPYVLEPPPPGARVMAAGEQLEFNIVLVGHAIDQLALVIFAMQRALNQGLTRQRIPAELQRVDWLDAQGRAQPVWAHTEPTLAAHPTVLDVPALPPSTEAITLHIHTPLRLQSQGQPLRADQLTPRALVAAVARRVALVMEFHAGQSGWGEAAKHVAHLGQTLTDARDLHWFDWTRYSSRQQQEMTLGGVLGHWTLHGTPDVLAEVWPWLWLGQWLHVGKNATMGMGGFKLESLRKM
jgi:hypothetical protein